MKIKIRRADTLFSNHIRLRDNWKCQADGKDFTNSPQGLHCSHFWSRSHESTRYEPDNCIALCYYHHQLWGHGEGRDQYKEFMKNKLGLKRFKSLDVQAHTYHKKDDSKVLLWLKGLTK